MTNEEKIHEHRKVIKGNNLTFISLISETKCNNTKNVLTELMKYNTEFLQNK